MDAKRTLGWVWACGLVVVCGCTDYYPYPAARREKEKPPERKEPPQIVDTKPDRDKGTPEDDTNETVLGWVDRLDDVERRARRRDPRQSQRVGDLRHASDPQPPTTTRPADQAPTEAPPGATDDTPTSSPADSAEGAATQPNALSPPELGRIAVRAAPISQTIASNPLGPEINAPAYARGAPTSLREFLHQFPPADEGSFRDQTDRRMLWVIAGDYEQARAPLNLVTAEQKELATRFVEAWIVIRDWHMGDQPGAAAAAARELDELQKILRRLSDLSIPALKICSVVRGYGQYDTIQPARFLAGTPSEFVLYCEVSNFVSELGEDDHYTTRFDMITTILNRAGDTVLEIKDTGIVDRCRNCRQDCFVPRLVRLPATLSPGQYVAKVSVIDKLGQKVAENRTTFELVARP